MQSVSTTHVLVKRPTDLHQYAACLRVYVATWHDAQGTITGTARELFAHGGAALEFRALHCAERRIVRRQDLRLTLGARL